MLSLIFSQQFGFSVCFSEQSKSGGVKTSLGGSNDWPPIQVRKLVIFLTKEKGSSMREPLSPNRVVLGLGSEESCEGLHSAEVAFLLFTQQPLAWFSAFPRISFNVAEIYQWRWLEGSGQRFDNVNGTHQVLTTLYSKKGSTEPVG